MTEPFDPVAKLIALEVKLAEWVFRHREDILSASVQEEGGDIPWSDYGFKWPAYTLVHLFETPHPANPLHKQERCAELAMQLVDRAAACWEARDAEGKPPSTREVPYYVLACVWTQLGERVSAERKARWTRYAEAWAAQALRVPEGKTACYHDSWRMTGLYLLGQTLGRPEWTEMGRFLFRQMLSLQTAEGFWEDGRHHGPSMRYCGLMLPSLAWMYRWTGDEAFGAAAQRLSRFVATWSFPDALTVGAFDGRNCNVAAFFPTCAGMELTPEGRAWTARAFGLWRDLDMFCPERAAPSTRDLPRVMFYVADTCRYLQQAAPAPQENVDPTGALPLEREGTLEQHSTEFDSLLHRAAPWVVALSSQNSEVPKIGKSRYRLERQSRIELWHEKARLVVGGGHNHKDWDLILASAILDSGYIGSMHFGRAQAGLESRQRYYFPLNARSRMTDGAPELELIFGHGTVRFRIVCESASLCRIRADWEVLHLERLMLQVPLVAWQGMVLSADGKSLERSEQEGAPVARTVSLRGGPFGAQVELALPPGAACRLHYPIETGAFHDFVHEGDPMRNPFAIALVSCQWERPARTSSAAFEIALR